MLEDHLGSPPLLSYYDDSKESNKSNGLTTDIDNGNIQSFLISEVLGEIKDLYTIAIPTIITDLLTYGKLAISMHFLGKIGKEALIGGSLAIGMANITGFSIISDLTSGMEGLALVGAFTNLNILIILLLYLRFSEVCSKSWQGLLHNAAETIATYGIIIQATSLIYNFPFALSLAVSTKVGNELGANRPNKAKTSSFTALLCAFFTSIVAMLFMVTVSKAWGRMFIEDEVILSLISTLLPIVGLCEIGNCPQTIICGVLKGSARPALGANINLVSFYGVGLPVAPLMGFVFDLGLLGLMLGLLSAQIVCFIVMMVVLVRTNWKEQADRAKELIGGINVSNGENNEGMEGLV
ncbi:Multidrug and toxin extrusion protein 2 [Spatholobus suberectus]|nr:Multidrug and toxin extrusion protein 2 [Spatholobus suberectus]